MNINEPHPSIKCHYTRWKRNREFVAGEDAVKCSDANYLPKLPSQSDSDYLNYKEAVDFFPGALRTLESHVGLIFRKDAHFVAPPGHDELWETVNDHKNKDQLARHLLGERIVTGYTGLLIDHDAQPEGLSAAQASAAGYHARISVYAAEAILDVVPMIVGGKRVIAQVRLLDDEKTVRELRLDAGVYTQNIHTLTEGGDWMLVETITPLKNGAALDHIPFVLDNSNPGGHLPAKAPLDEVVNVNRQLYRAQAQLNNTLRNVASPMRVICGADDENRTYTVSPDSIWVFTSPETKVQFLEMSGNGAGALRQQVRDKIEEMAAIGARTLQSEKAAAETAEAMSIRKASENSLLASIANSVSENYTKALREVANWSNINGEVTYRLNTDFLPESMKPEEVTALFGLVQAGKLSTESFYERLQAGEILSDAISWEEEKQRIAQDSFDAPPINTDTGPGDIVN
jgi:hypothetical protein